MFKKRLKQQRSKLHLFVLLFLADILIVGFSQSYAQTISVQGRVRAARYPVSDALITFISNADTTDRYSTMTDATGSFQIEVLPVSVSATENNIPDKFELSQSYPNPFSSSTAITYQLNKASDVQVTIYDVLGREVRKFRPGIQSPGSYNVLWDGRNSSGERVANGVYFYRLQTGAESQTGKMVFNAGGNAVASSPRPYSSQLSKENEVTKQAIQDGNYTIRIENTDNTTPLIVSTEVENVPVKNDTTINLTVDYIASTTVDLDDQQQLIRGFGAANILQWRPDMTDSEIETAFGTGEGQLGFTILRLRIQPQKNLWSTNIPTAKKAHDMGALIFASPWNAPDEMLETVGGQRRVRYDMYDEYAAHLDSFNTYMSNNGVPMYGISVQNEPDFAEDWTGWTPDEMLRFMRENASSIGTRVIAPESFQFRRAMSDPILNDSLAAANLDIVGGHIYGGGLSRYPLAEEKGKEVWMTEHLTESSHSANIWSYALDVGLEMHQVMAANMNAYVWWYIVRYYGPIGDGERSATFPNEDFAEKGEVTKKGYVMSQFSRFIRPGYHRVASPISPPVGQFYATAYKDTSSSKVVFVAVNTSSSSMDVVFRIQNGTVNSFATYTTTESKNVVRGDDVTVTDNRFMYNLEASSVTTFVSN